MTEQVVIRIGLRELPFRIIHNENELNSLDNNWLSWKTNTRAALESEDLGSVPSLQQVKLEIGPFSSQIRKEIKANTSKRRRRRV